VEQESSMLGYHLLIREALTEQDYDDFEKYYEFSLKPRFDMLDRTLTALADEYGKAQPVKEPLPSRLACANELYAELWFAIRRSPMPSSARSVPNGI
jgi:hypothetical protein